MNRPALAVTVKKIQRQTPGFRCSQRVTLRMTVNIVVETPFRIMPKY